MTRTSSFWDSSAVVPLCVEQKASRSAAIAQKDQSIAVWWGTAVEATGAFCRLYRDRAITHPDLEAALVRLQMLEGSWTEVLPTANVRALARLLVQRRSLRAADAFQLAAALVWAKERPSRHPFVCLDLRLADAARREGFSVETPGAD